MKTFHNYYIPQGFIVSYIKFLILLFIIYPGTLYSQRITIDGNTFRVYGKEIFINGVNTSWDNWNDFGGNYDHSFWDTEFQEIRQAGGNASRIWNSDCSGCERNFWSGQNLQAQYNSPDAFLDFYSPHFYGWVVRWFGNFALDKTPDDFDINDLPCMVGENPARGVYKQNTSGQDELIVPISDAYIKTYQQGWKGLMVWTSNGVDGNGSLANCGAGLTSFQTQYPELVSPDSSTTMTQDIFDSKTVLWPNPASDLSILNIQVIQKYLSGFSIYMAG